MKKYLSVLFIFLSLMACRQVDDKQSLQGKWLFALDPNDIGLTEQWYNKSLNDTIHLPGSLQEQGYGDNVGIETPWTGQIVDRSWYDAPQYEKFRQPGNIKVPFWLNPDKHYVGVAWYQKEVEIPASWNGRPDRTRTGTHALGNDALSGWHGNGETRITVHSVQTHF